MYLEKLEGVRIDAPPEILVVPSRVRERLSSFPTTATIVSGNRWEVMFRDGYGGYLVLRSHWLIDRARSWLRAQKKKK